MVRNQHNVGTQSSLQEHEVPVDRDRTGLVRRGLILNYVTIGYNAVEAFVSIVAGVIAGSVSLVGFGLDSVVEVTASLAAQWRLRSDLDVEVRRRVERHSHRIIALSFLALAAYVAWESVSALRRGEGPERSIPGVAILTASVVVMPLLARSKRRIAIALSSGALVSEAKQTSLCAYLSAIALVGVGLTTFFGLWWADSVAALGMVPIIAIEGIEGVRGEKHCDDCDPVEL